jgi:hypothetical protein
MDVRNKKLSTFHFIFFMLQTSLPPCISDIWESYLPPIYFNLDNLKCTKDHCWCVDAIEEGWPELIQCKVGQILRAGARQGSIEVLQLLQDCGGYILDEWVCFWAAQHGHLHIIQWAHSNGCPWDDRTCSAAARYGHLNILQWVRENGCPWDKWTCFAAAEAGHLNILQWAREHGCPQ